MGKMRVLREPAKQAAVYLRKSSDQQEASIDRQRESIAKYAANHDYVVVEEYVDSGISGLDSSENRKGFQRLISDANANRFSYVIVWDMSRISRSDPMRTAVELMPLREAGCQLVPTDRTEPIRWDDFADQIRMAVDSGTNNQYIRKMARATTDGQIKLAREGKWVAGKPPFGLKKGKNGKLVLGDPASVEIVRGVFDSYAKGASLRNIVEELRGKGQNRGVAWVTNVLHNELYSGDWVWPRTQQGKIYAPRNGVAVELKGSARRKVSDAEQIRIDKNHVALVDRRTFNRVKTKLIQNERVRHTTPHRNGGGFILTGLLRCADCGYRMTGQKNKGGRIQFRCNGSLQRGIAFCHSHLVPQDVILDAVAESLKAELTSPETVERAKAAIRNKAKKSKPSNVPGLKRRLTSANRRLEKAKSRLVEVDADMVSVVQEQIRKTKAEIANLERELKHATTPVEESIAEMELKSEQIRQWLDNFGEVLRNADPRKVREFLMEVIKQVTVNVSRAKAGTRYRYKFEGGNILLNDNNKLFSSW